MTRDHAFNLLKGVRDERNAGRVAIAQTLKEIDANIAFLQAITQAGVGKSELQRCARNIEITYVLRLFSEFEAILRGYWAAVGRKSNPRIMPLMNRVAVRCLISSADLARAHDVREFRNDIIHENLRNMRLSFDECKRNLGVFMRWLPIEW